MIRSVFALALLASTATPASAALFVSGDSNISSFVSSSVANQNFFRNIVEGTKVTIQQSTILSSFLTPLVDYYNGNGFSASLLGTAAMITAADLSGTDLFIGFLPDDAYTTGEIRLLSNFLNDGGNVLLVGENAFFPDINARINAALTRLGSGMRIVNAGIDSGFNIAQLQGPSAYLASTAGFQFASTSTVTGGLGLFGTATGNQTFLAVEVGTQVVPEPASWAMLIAGFGLTGAVMRRRRSIATAG